MNRKNILVIFGGCSPEHGVSLQSAQSVLEHIDREKYAVTILGINREGKWYRYSGPVSEISSGRWQDKRYCTPAAILPDRGERSLALFHDTAVERVKIDAALPILHGKNGEDGTVQGLLELAGIPCIGCGVLASALCMDKSRSHLLAEASGVPCAKGVTVSRGVERGTLQTIAAQLGYPLFVKPLRAGSSFGISRVTTPEQLSTAVAAAFEYDGSVIIEQAIDGVELGCAVIGNDELITGELDEIELSGGFFDFDEKYSLKSSRIHVPARISEEKAQEVKAAAKTVYRALDCSGFARVDMFLTPEGKIYFNEVNTIPGFTVHSRFPGMMAAAGMGFSAVLERIIEEGIRCSGN